MGKAQVMERLEKASTERFPNAVPKNVADALYPAFDPDNKGEVDFIAAAKGLAVFFSTTDEDGDGKVNKSEMKKFLVFINETQCLGLKDAEIDQVNTEIFTELGKTELTIDDVRAVVAARWGA